MRNSQHENSYNLQSKFLFSPLFNTDQTHQAKSEQMVTECIDIEKSLVTFDLVAFHATTDLSSKPFMTKLILSTSYVCVAKRSEIITDLTAIL